MEKEKEMNEISQMLQGVSPRNILISFDDKPAKSLEAHLQEQQRKQAKQSGKKERER